MRGTTDDHDTTDPGAHAVTAANAFVQDATTSGRVVEIRREDAQASITLERDATVRVTFRVRCGSVSEHRRRQVVEAVFARPEVRGARVVHATVPVGDVELRWQVERRLQVADTRVAGASCLLDGAVRAVEP